MPELKPWIDELLVELEDRAGPAELATGASRALYYLRVVRGLGRQIGIPELSPRGLRHTAIQRCLRKYHDINVARRWFSCSARVALDYARSEIDEEIDRRAVTEGV